MYSSLSNGSLPIVYATDFSYKFALFKTRRVPEIKLRANWSELLVAVHAMTPFAAESDRLMRSLPKVATRVPVSFEK